MTNEYWRWTATETVAALRGRDVRPRDLIESAVGRIEAVDGAVNALPMLCIDRAMDQAQAMENNLSGDQNVLAGLPIAVKDYNSVGGVATTYGSPIFADHVPTTSDAMTRMLEARGAIPLAKSNVPEWAGGHTFNPVYGLTRNPWNTGRSAGGSSGGSAAALASGQVWLATGNDLGGSLRTPAGFNGVVGMRPGPGVVPRGERCPSYDTLWVEGPMARTVEDLALMLDAMAGHSSADALSFDQAGSYVDALVMEQAPRRIGFSADLGVVPCAREIAEVTGSAASSLGDHGVDVTDDIPNFTGVLEGFQTLRAVLLGGMMGDMLKTDRHRINEDIVGNIERGFAVTPEQLFSAERVRTAIYHRMMKFFETHDLLICPTASIAPFPVDQRYVTEIDGIPCETYIDWFAVTFAITMTACPVVSLPCGYTPEGLPIGLQLVGKPRGEAELLRHARWIEDRFGLKGDTPIDPRVPEDDQ
jgi:amidase